MKANKHEKRAQARLCLRWRKIKVEKTAIEIARWSMRHKAKVLASPSSRRELMLTHVLHHSALALLAEGSLLGQVVQCYTSNILRICFFDGLSDKSFG